MDIRPAELSDYDAVADIYEQSTKLHASLEPGWIKEDRPYGIKKEDYKRIIKGDNSSIMVAAINNKVVGFIEMCVRHEDENDYFYKKDYVWVDDVAVDEENRGKGVGSKLMAAVEEWAKIKGVDTIELTTRVANPRAIKFYKKLGYDNYVVRSKKHIN